MTTATLHRLLEEHLPRPAEYRGRLSSHLPMALQALHSMGASDQRLIEFAAGYARQLSPPEAAVDTASRPDWRLQLGDAEAFAALRAGFAAELAADGRDAVLRRTLPALWPGVAAAAFHGLIRTAHAVETGHAGELAAALAYWASRWQPVAPPTLPEPGESMAFDDWAAALAEGAAGWRSAGTMISDRIEDAQRADVYRRLAGRLPVQGDTLQRLATFSAQCYAQTRHFTVLHLVTGCRAARVLWPWVDDAPAAGAALVLAWAAAFVTCGLPATPSAPADTAELTWPELLAAGCAADDAHIVKIVHACRDHARAYGDDGPWLAAAQRAVSQPEA